MSSSGFSELESLAANRYQEGPMEDLDSVDPEAPTDPMILEATPQNVLIRQQGCQADLGCLANLLRHVDELDLSVRSTNCLNNARIEYVFQLVAMTEVQLLKIKNFGRKSLHEIQEILVGLGLGFGMRLPIEVGDYAVIEDAREALRNCLVENGSLERPLPSETPATLLPVVPQAILDEPWEKHLDVSVRTWHGLVAAGLQTMADVQGARDADLLKLKNFGRKSLRELRQALAGFERKYGSLEAPLRNRRLDEMGLSDQPASILGPAFRAALVPIEAQHGAQTLGSLALLLPRLFCEAGTDSTQVQRLAEALHRLVDDGPEAFPNRPEDLIVIALGELPTRDREAIKLRYLEQATLSEVGSHFGISRERARQVTREAMYGLQNRWTTYAAALAQPVLVRLERSSGLIHEDDLLDCLDGLSLVELILILHIAGHDDLRIWQDAFLMRRSVDPEAIIRDISETIRRSARSTINRRELAELVTRFNGVHLLPRTFDRLLTDRLGIEFGQGADIDVQEKTSLVDRLATVLREEGRPMHAIELAIRLGFYSEEQALRSATPSERNPILQRVQGVVDRCEPAYRCGKGIIVHREALPLALELLGDAVEWGVRRIAGRKGPISTKTLLQEMASIGTVPEGLSEYLLKDAMKRHADVVGLRKLQVGYAATFEEHGLTMKDRVLAILHRAHAPLKLEEVREALSAEGTEYSEPGVSQFLTCSPLVVSLGANRFIHPDRIGLSPFERGSVVEAAVALLPEDGQPVSVKFLHESLATEHGFGDLADPDDYPSVLWALLRGDERVAASTRGLVALKTEMKDDSLAERLVLHRLRLLGAATRSEVERALANDDGCLFGESTVGIIIARLIASGVVRPLFANLYALVDTDNDALFSALFARRERVLRAAAAPEAADWPWQDLDLMARFLYREGLSADALRFLNTLIERGDLPEEASRRVRRLWSVVRSLVEE